MLQCFSTFNFILWIFGDTSAFCFNFAVTYTYNIQSFAYIVSAATCVHTTSIYSTHISIKFSLLPTQHIHIPLLSTRHNIFHCCQHGTYTFHWCQHGTYIFYCCQHDTYKFHCCPHSTCIFLCCQHGTYNSHWYQHVTYTFHFCQQGTYKFHSCRHGTCTYSLLPTRPKHFILQPRIQCISFLLPSAHNSPSQLIYCHYVITISFIPVGMSTQIFSPSWRYVSFHIYFCSANNLTTTVVITFIARFLSYTVEACWAVGWLSTDHSNNSCGYTPTHFFFACGPAPIILFGYTPTPFLCLMPRAHNSFQIYSFTKFCLWPRANTNYSCFWLRAPTSILSAPRPHHSFGPAPTPYMQDTQQITMQIKQNKTKQLQQHT